MSTLPADGTGDHDGPAQASATPEPIDVEQSRPSRRMIMVAGSKVGDLGALSDDELIDELESALAESRLALAHLDELDDRGPDLLRDRPDLREAIDAEYAALTETIRAVIEPTLLATQERWAETFGSIAATASRLAPDFSDAFSKLVVPDIAKTIAPLSAGFDFSDAFSNIARIDTGVTPVFRFEPPPIGDLVTVDLYDRPLDDPDLVAAAVDHQTERWERDGAALVALESTAATLVALQQHFVRAEATASERHAELTAAVARPNRTMLIASIIAAVAAVAAVVVSVVALADDSQPSAPAPLQQDRP